MPKNNENKNDGTSKPKMSESSHSTEKTSRSRFSNRKLTYDWSKYDELPPEEPEDHIDQHDFDYLSKNYSADNNYFQLSSEKEWTKPAAIPNSNLFSLNLNTLSAGLATIPFYDLIDLDKNLLSESCIASCDAEAEANLLKYKRTLNNLNAQQSSKQDDIIKTGLVEETHVASALDSSLHITPPEEIVPPVAKAESVDISKSDDLEDWLDSVLDD